MCVVKQEINSYFASLMKLEGIRTVGYALIQGAKIVAADTLTIDATTMVSPFSLFQGCSFSKVITTIATLKLLAKGLQLDSPINAQLKTWKIPSGAFDANAVTPRQCLNMTSGLSFGKPGLALPGYTQDKAVPPLRSLLDGTPPAITPGIMLTEHPGTKYRYTGAGYMVLQQLIEEMTGQSFSEYIEETIFAPLKMTSSSFKCPLGDLQQQQAISGYDGDGKQVDQGWENIVTTASGGLWTTPSDMAALLSYMSDAFLKIREEVISSTIMNQMFSLRPGHEFGLGVVVDGKDASLNFRKVGYNMGYYNQLIMFPSQKSGVVIMTNSANGKVLVEKCIEWVATTYKFPAFNPNFDEIQLS